MSKNDCGGSKPRLLVALPFMLPSCISPTVITIILGEFTDPRIRVTWNKVSIFSWVPRLAKFNCLINQLPDDLQGQEDI
jgi:hypothetical protein